MREAKEWMKWRFPLSFFLSFSHSQIMYTRLNEKKVSLNSKNGNFSDKELCYLNVFFLSFRFCRSTINHNHFVEYTRVDLPLPIHHLSFCFDLWHTHFNSTVKSFFLSHGFCYLFLRNYRLIYFNLKFS